MDLIYTYTKAEIIRFTYGRVTSCLCRKTLKVADWLEHAPVWSVISTLTNIEILVWPLWINSLGSGRSLYEVGGLVIHFSWTYWWFLNSFTLFSLLEQLSRQTCTSVLISYDYITHRPHRAYQRAVPRSLCCLTVDTLWMLTSSQHGNLNEASIAIILNLSLGKKTNSSQ